MALDWIVELDCSPKQTLGRGDHEEGTDALLGCLKARNRAAALAEAAERNGDAPEAQAIELHVAGPDGAVEARRVSYQELVAHARGLEGLEAACRGCPANVHEQPFGCIGAVPYPVTARAEQWLAERIQPASTIGGTILLEAIADLGYTGESVQAFREQGMFERREPVRLDINDGAPEARLVSTNQVFQAILDVEQPLQPSHSVMLLVWLGLLQLDGEQVTSAAQAQALSRLVSPQERQERTALTIDETPPAADVAALQWLLRAMYRSWQTGTPLQVWA